MNAVLNKIEVVRAAATHGAALAGELQGAGAAQPRARGARARRRAALARRYDCDDCEDFEGLRAMMPNLKFVLRNNVLSSASRSVIAKPESADNRLHELTCRLFTDQQSITQIIQLSDVWRREFAGFAGAQAAGDPSAAERRHETKLKPRGQFVLNFDAFLQTALLIVMQVDTGIVADGQDIRRHAVSFLQDTSVEDVVLAAMLADAADEALALMHQLDKTDSMDASAHVDGFLRAIHTLFIKGKCTELPGFTAHMLALLQHPNSFQAAPTLPARVFGGPGVVNDAMVACCLGHMGSYARLAIAAARRDFPHVDVLSFGAFRLDAPPTLLRVRGESTAALARPEWPADHETATTDLQSGAACPAPDATLRLRDSDSTAALARPDLSVEQREDLQRLAVFCNADAALVETQYLESMQVAMAHKTATKGDDGSAWQHAIQALSPIDGPSAAFLHMAMRYFCYRELSAATKQYARLDLDHLFSLVRHSADEAPDDQILRVLLNPATNDDMIMQRGQAPAPPPPPIILQKQI